MIDEAWKKVEGFENYEVSNRGSIRNKLTKKILSPGNDGRGYLLISLYSDSCEKKTQKVHRIVAKAFVEGYEEGLDVNHLDCDRKNNGSDNLAWCTRRENIRYGIKCGNYNQTGSRNNFSKLTESNVVEIKRKIEKGELTKSIAKQFDVCMGTIYSIKKGDTWKHVC
ncbi:hypothetical protein GOV11_00910 [Candidatus Woesearchaeota archaeon]|nr:hypothetical protein [Candidatus Woesearchaeota archaeon]